MSDWVGALIIEAISDNEEVKVPEPHQVESTAPRKKKLPKTDDTVQQTEQGVPVYSQPPFWAKQVVEFDEDGNVIEPIEGPDGHETLDGVEATEVMEATAVEGLDSVETAEPVVAVHEAIASE
jgi:hypothetical protein